MLESNDTSLLTVSDDDTSRESSVTTRIFLDIKNLDIELPDINTQNELVLLLQNMQDKIITEKKMLSLLETQKVSC